MDVFLPRTGRIYLDFIFAGLPKLPVAGEEVFAKSLSLMVGGSYNAARALWRLGVDAHLAADLGNDEFSAIARRLWDEDGLPTTFRRELDRPCAAVTCAYSLAHDRALLSYVDPLPPPDADPRLLDEHGVRCVLLSGLPDDDAFWPLLEHARNRSIPIVLDCQHNDHRLDDPLIRRMTELVDVFMLNSREACTLTQTSSVDGAIDVLAPHVRCLVVKRGEDGAVLVRDGSRLEQTAPKVDVVDTTGAGDCFAAGFTFGVVRGMDDAAALAHAVAAGSIACTGPGGDAAPDLSALEEMLRELPR
ncbi:MAG: carbohydrate kinase family protein [Deltaproteobacteria bacterium]|nr:carbohydrate kinase family protein [Deltaproteobacteria bacterium]MCB9478531.1 carbohydrate kinase family protein [Deltaproteobacteria bacterium]